MTRPIEREIERQTLALSRGDGAIPRMPYLGDGRTRAVNFLEAYARLVAVSVARAEFYGELLAEQFEQDRARAERADREHLAPGVDPDPGSMADPTAGLIGFTYATNVLGPARDQEIELTATGEEVRALVRLEAEERDRAAKLIEKAVKMGVQLQQVEVIRSYAATISAALQGVVGELGLSMRSEPVLRAAQRAALTARRQLGQDDGDPDLHVGPRMTAVERVTALREALARAEADAGVIEG
jgi:hypothetical protein